LRKAFLVFLLAGFLTAGLHAADQTFTFALPEAEGRISLGVFDAAGELVRTLFVAAEEKDFQIGLNGLIATWDGRDDGGKTLPTGRYRIRGWVVPDSVQAEGVAYHFNDWITDDTSPRISGIGALAPVGDGRFWLFGFRPGREAAESVLWTYCDPEIEEVTLTLTNGNSETLDDPSRDSVLSQHPSGQWPETEGSLRIPDPPGLQPRRSWSSKATFLNASPDVAAVSDGQTTFFFPWDVTQVLAEGRVAKEWVEPGAFVVGAIWRDMFYGVTDSTSRELLARSCRERANAMPVEFVRVEAPVAGLRFDANEAALVGWTADAVWLYRGKAFQPAAIAELPTGFDLSAGPEETLWVAGQSGPDVVVRQHAFTGELLREMKIREDFAEQVHVFASKNSLSFYLLLQSRHWSRQTVRGYRPIAQSAPGENAESMPVDWEVFFDKTIENSRRFGLKDGRLVADVGNAPQPDRQKIALPEDSLTGKKGSIVVTAVSRKDGLWMTSGDGLPLRRLSDSDVERIVVVPGETAGSLRLFTGNGVVVAEYLLTGLTGLAAIDAGEVELP
jgi:hypothetical protein